MIKENLVTEQKRKLLQQEIFQIFLEVKQVCEKLNIEYFIMGGTALGAVRHGGFIPWDDDFDIGMTRENYDRFLSEAGKFLPSGLFLQTYQTEPHSPFYFAKVRKDGTCFIERYCKNLPIHSGIYIDIFPYDALPDDEKQRKKYYKQGRWRLNWYIAKEVRGISTNPGGLKKIVLETVRSIMHILLFPVPKKVIFDWLDQYLRKYNGIERQMLGYAGLPRIQVPYADVEQPDQILFEGVLVSCPKHIHKYLESNYGNYLEIPPEAQRGGHDVYRMSL